MKTQPMDFVISGLAIALIVGIAGAITGLLFAPISVRLVGAYHVVADALLFLLAYGLLSALCVRLLLTIWPLRPGEHSMDAAVFFVWKLVHVLSEFGRGALLPFTSVFAKPIVAQLFGAKVGRNTALAGSMTDLSLISIGHGVICGLNSVITGHAITSGKIIFREVRIGQGATIGVGVVVMPGVMIGEGAVVAAGSVVPPGTTIPAGELWAGVPARKIKNASALEIRG